MHTVAINKRPPVKLYKQRSEGVRYNFFSHRIINVWNSLSADIVVFKTLSTFKTTIKSIDFTDFLKASK